MLRKSLIQSFALLILFVGSVNAAASDDSFYPDPPVPGPGEVEYMNPNPPEFELPKYEGERYEALIPATLDLAERARLGVNGMTEIVNKNCEYEIFSIIQHMSQPPSMFHSISDLTSHGKFLAVLPLMRIMSGSRQNMDVEKALLEVLLKMQGEDGLIYTPASGGRHWVLPAAFDPASGLPGYNDGHKQVCLLGYANARSLAAFDNYNRLAPEGPWADAAKKLVGGYHKNIIQDGDYAHVFQTWTTPGREVVKKEEPFGPHLYLAGSQAWIALHLAKHDAAVGDPEAVKLAEKMMNYNLLKVEYNEPDGRFKFGGPGVGAEYLKGKCAHFHTHAMNILAALYVAKRNGNEVLLDRGVKAYEWGVKAGETLVGYFPMVTYDEYVGIQTSETCQVADMVMAGVLLCQLGIDKWDDVDRWTRNQLAENQMTSNCWLEDGHLDYSRSEMGEGFFKPEYYSTDRVGERSIGNFAGWPAPNDWAYAEDWWGGNTQRLIPTVMTCCTGSGCRALYHVWKNILTYDEGTLKVNLLLNRASKWADVDSHIPYTGQVDIKVKQPLNLQVRIPEWVKPNEAVCKINGQAKALTFDGRYAGVGNVKEGQTVVVTFPISERTEKKNIEGFDYTLIVRGNDVVSIDPPGKNLPMYQRGHYRGGKTLWKKATRFVAEDELDW